MGFQPSTVGAHLAYLYLPPGHLVSSQSYGDLAPLPTFTANVSRGGCVVQQTVAGGVGDSGKIVEKSPFFFGGGSNPT